MNFKVVLLMTGVAGAQALFLGSGCTSESALARRGYIPAVEPDYQVETQVAGAQDQTPPAAKNDFVIEGEEAPMQQSTYKPAVSERPVSSRPATTSYSSAEPQKYVVNKGDTLGKIGQKYGVGAAALAAYNNIDIKKPIRIGQTIMIPPPGTVISVPKNTTASSTKATAKPAAKTTAVATPATGALADGYYQVKKGDSVSKIASNFKVKRADLMKANNINENTVLQIGQKLVIPGKSPAGTQVAAKTSPAKTIASTPPAAKTVAPAPVADKPVVPVSTDKPATDSNVDDIFGDLSRPATTTTTSTTPAADTTTVAPAAAAATTPVTPVSSLLKKPSIETPTETTLEELSAQFGFSVEDLKKENPDLKEGQTIRSKTIIFLPAGK